jgi:hypothetical protein
MNLSEKLSLKADHRQVSISEAFYPVSRHIYYTVFILPRFPNEKLCHEFESLEALENWIHEYRQEAI